jgi:hypothetical protein
VEIKRIAFVPFLFHFLLVVGVSSSASLHHRFSPALLQQKGQQASSGISLGPEDTKGPRPIKNPTPQLFMPILFPFPSPSQRAHIHRTPAQPDALHILQGLGLPDSGGPGLLIARTMEASVGWQLLEELVLKILLAAGTNARCGDGSCSHGTRTYYFFACCCPPRSHMLLLLTRARASLPSSRISMIPHHWSAFNWTPMAKVRR